jgi:D-amino-acid oxidase
MGNGTDSGTVVVGGGVIGLTTAVVLAERGRRVRVWSRDPVEATTSAVAGALWEPYRIEPPELVLDWAGRTFAVLAELAGRPGETGVRMVEGTQIAPGPPEWAGIVPGLRMAGPGELPPDMPTYLRYLVRRLEAAGGRVERREVATLDEAGREASCVVNCTGLGARELVPDPRMRPVRGQLVIVENPGIFEWFLADGDDDSESLYIFPQPYGLVLGGTAHENAPHITPDPALASAIVRRCARFDPRLAEARVIEHRVGLRPCRDEVRLSRQALPGGTVCVHNYGHGGAGVTVSWACAADAAELAMSR